MEAGRHARTSPKVYLRPRGFPDFTPHPPPSRALNPPHNMFVWHSAASARPSALLQLLPQNLSHVLSYVALLNMTTLSYIYFR